jgi:putative SOS response-associated peptidase YedK
MCGRYVRRNSKQKIAEWFHVDGDLANLPMPDADYNIAPTTSQPIIRQSREPGEREIAGFQIIRRRMHIFCTLSKAARVS